MRRNYIFSFVLCSFQTWQFFAGVIGVSTQPHIIFIIADDLGWNDVGFRGSNQIPTPNIDALAYNGIVLDRHYTQPCCSPSRAALLTGKYPIRYGMQGIPIIAGYALGIPLNETLLPEYMQNVGYVTRLIGKWHVGCYKSSMTPTRRGFHSHFGYLNGYVSYKNGTHTSKGVVGFDAFRNSHRSKTEVVGKYLTDVYTKEAVNTIKHHSRSKAPLFLVVSHLAPHTGAARILEVRDEAENSKKFAYITDSTRQLFAGMIEALDSSVGAIIEALDSSNMLQNSVVVFIADNGGPTTDPNWGTENSASNWPLRGLKMSTFEGGTRGVAVTWSPLFKQRGRSSKSYMHISDWLPTLYSAAGGNVDRLQGLDGINQWSHLVDEEIPSPRNDILVNIDENRGDWAVVRDEWKLIKVNRSSVFNFTHYYYGETGRHERYRLDLVLNSPVSKILRREDPNIEPREEYLRRRDHLDLSLSSECKERIADISSDDPYTGVVPPDVASCDEAPCLFNIHRDPCEYHNVANQHPLIVSKLSKLFDSYNSKLVKQQNSGFDPAAHPDNWGGYWVPWMDHDKSVSS